MKIFSILLIGFCLFRKGSSAPPPLGVLGSQGEGFGGATFRDARQTPIFNDLGPHNFVLPPEVIESKEAALGESNLVEPQRSPGATGKSIDASRESANIKPLLVGFTPITGSEPLFPSLPDEVPLPSEDGGNQAIKQHSVSRVGIALPDSTSNFPRVNAGVQFSPFSDQADSFNLGTLGVQVSSEQNPQRAQIILDRNTNNIFGVSLGSEQNPSDSIDLSSLFGDSQGISLPSSNNGNFNVQISPGIRQSSVGQNDLTSQSFIETSDVGVPLPSSNGGNLNDQVSSGLSLPPNGQNEFNLQLFNDPSQIPDRGLPISDAGILSLQDRRNFNIQASGDFGVPLPTLVENNQGLPNSQVVNSKNQGEGLDEISLSSAGESLISSQGQNAIKEFPVGPIVLDSAFPTLPNVDERPSLNDPPNQSLLPSSFQSTGAEIDRNSGIALSSISGDPGEAQISLSNDITLGSLLESLASEPGPIDLTSALTESGDALKGIENLTIGDLLMGINGHNGIMVVPISSVTGNNDGNSLQDFISDNNIGKSVADASLSSSELIPVNIGVEIPGVGVSIDLSADTSETSPVTTPAAPTTTTRRARRRRPTTTRPPQVLRDILSEMLFSKGQWFGTLIGGMIDYGIILRDAFRDNFSKRHQTYRHPKIENSYSASRKK